MIRIACLIVSTNGNETKTGDPRRVEPLHHIGGAPVPNRQVGFLASGLQEIVVTQ